MIDYSDPFESPYLKRLRVWKERARQMSILHAQQEFERRLLAESEKRMEREWAKYKERTAAE